MTNARQSWSYLAQWLPLVLLWGAPSWAEEKILYEKPSPFSTLVVTEDDRGLRTLRFGRTGVRQSVVKPGDPDHLELRYAPGMFVGLAFCSRPQRILIVGVGGGTLPMFLHKHFPQTAIDAVDIDPDVIQVARDYFGLQVDQQLRAHASDGRKFIEQCRDPYDIIMLDAFSNDEIPFSLATREFLQAVRRAVTPDGVVVGNVWGRYSNKLYDDMVRTYQEVFDELYILDIRGAGNQILLALPRRLHLSREDLTRRAQTLFPKGRVRFNLGDIVQDGYHYADTQSRDARVLRDGDRK